MEKTSPAWPPAGDARLRALADALEEGVVSFTRTGVPDWCNAAAERLLGCPLESLRARRADEPLFRAFDARGRLLAAADFPHARTLASGAPRRRVTLRAELPDGRTRWLEANAEPVIDGESRRLEGAVLAFSDATQRRGAEEELRSLSMAMDQNPVAVVIASLDATIEYVNAAFVRASGYQSSELVGRNSRMLQSGRTPRTTYEAMWAALARGESWRGEFINRRRDGQEYHEEAVIVPMHDAGGRVVRYLGIKVDVTQERRLRSEVEEHRARLDEMVRARTRELEAARTRLRERNAWLEDVAAIIAHDLQAPVRAMAGRAAIVLDEEGARLSAEGTRHLAAAVAAGRRLRVMLDDIVAYTRAEHVELRRAEVDLTDVASGAARDLAPAYPGARVSVRPLPRVRADPAMMRQVFENLLGNALKFSSGRPEPHVEVFASGDAAAPEIVVRDNGAGFDAGHAGRLFRMFQRLHPEGDFPGTGMGLAIVRSLVERHGGRVRAESSPGGPTDFAFSVGAAISPAGRD